MQKYFLFLLFSFSLMNAQNLSPWKKIDNKNLKLIQRWKQRDNSILTEVFAFDMELMQNSLVKIQKPNDEIVIEIPNKNGDLELFRIHEFSNFSPELQAQFPTIRAYSGVGITDTDARLHFSMSPEGIQTMVLRANQVAEFIERLNVTDSFYEVFQSDNQKKGAIPFQCTTNEERLTRQLVSKTNAISASNGQFKTLRLALACTSEYTAFFGGVPQALAAINATLTRVNGVFNRDLAVHLNLIPNNSILIYNNPTTDPFSDAAIGTNGSWNTELQQDLTAKIGSSNYDIGHLLGATGGGGDAGCIGCVCVAPSPSFPNGKGSAYTSPTDGIPQGDRFDIDFVAHEMGHQLGAYHTFSFDIEGTGSSIEPGSGSTIMAYAGVSDYNIQNQSDDYFSFVSIAQIQTNLASKTCPVSTNLTNQTPTADAGLDYTIPKGTPFVLRGKGVDPNGDTLSYTWEQNDSALTASGSSSLSISTKMDGPLFRSLPPSSSAIRYLPNLTKVISNSLYSNWESVSDISRTLHFVLTVRDNASMGLAQTQSDAMAVNVDATKGPFEITSMNNPDSYWPNLSLQTITWAVNKTTFLEGSSEVHIKLSLDGGQTFPITLKESTPNDGSEVIIVPDGIAAKDCRIMIAPTANIFYAINKESFAIGYSSVSNCSTYTFTTPIGIPETKDFATTSITVPSTDAVSDVNVAVQLTHPYLSDVQIEIENPEGKTVKLFDGDCNDTNGSLQLNFDDLGKWISCGNNNLQTIVPAGSLGVFNTTNPQGIWTLKTRDQFSGAVGQLQAATITICTKKFTKIPAENIDLSTVLLYPNPNKGEFNLVFSSPFTSGVSVLLHDLAGRKIFEKYFPSVPIFNETIHLPITQAGIYLLTVVDGTKKTVRKMIVE